MCTQSVGPVARNIVNVLALLYHLVALKACREQKHRTEKNPARTCLMESVTKDKNNNLVKPAKTEVIYVIWVF